MADATAPKAKGLWQRYKRLILGVVGLSAVILVARRLSIPDCATIQAQIKEWGLLAPIMFFCLYVVSTVAFIPGLIVTMMAGLAFGAGWGTLIVSVSSVTGATLAFLLARYVARDMVEGLLRQQAWFEKFKGSVEANGLSFVIFARLVPLFPFNGLNYACGLVPLRLRDYVLGSAIGMLPGTFAYVYLGETGCKLIDPMIQGNFSPADMPADVRNNLLIAIGLLAALSILPIGIKKLRRRPPG